MIFAEPAAEESAAPVTATMPKKKWSATPFKGMVADLKRRAPHYWSDWTDGFHTRVLSSTLFMVFTSIAPAITFAGVLSTETDNHLGPVEVILSTTITGSMFALFAGQPLCIVGVTGPVTIFTVAIYQLANNFDIPFIPFYAWTQIWAAIMHMLIAIFNLCDMIELVSRYSCETFGMLIAIIYLYTGIRHLVEYFIDKELAPALLSLMLGLGTAWLALTLSSARSWTVFSRTTRTLIADYGTTFAVAFFCAVPYMGDNYDLTPEKHGNETAATIAALKVPDTFETSSGRSWWADPGDCPTEWIFFAIIPGFILTVLFFFDHNVSSLLCQAPEFGLKKGTAYHWDFFIVGLQILLTGLLGIPPVNGLIPQAPLHTDSLCDKKFIEKNGRKVEVVVHCHEQRVSNLMQAVIIGMALFYIKGVGYLPIAALDGLFVYMGIASFGGNTFYNRILLLITDKEKLDARGLDFIDDVKRPTINKFTALQFFLLTLIFVITLLPYVAALFPICIAILVPLRVSILPKWFGTDNVEALDALGKAPDEEEAEAVTGGAPKLGATTKV